MKESKPPGIMISGYYGFGNAGDEAILASIVRQLKKNIPGVRIIVLSESPLETAAAFDVESHNRKDMLGIMRRMSKIDLLISGGGGLIQDSTGFSTVTYYLGIVQMAKMLGKKVMFYAQGLGPLNLSKSRKFAAFVMNQVDFITFRDEDSVTLAREIGVTKPPIHVTGDPVFALEAPGDDILDPVAKAEKLEPGAFRLGISVRPWKTDSDYIADIAKTADFFVKEKKAFVYLFPFQESQDLEICKKIQRQMENTARIIPRKYPVDVMLGLMGRMDMVLGMRLHSLIFSVVQNTPAAGISYDPKVSALCEIAGLPYLHLDVVTKDSIMDLALSVYEKKDDIKWNLPAKSSVLKEKAEKNTQLLIENLL
ncbi:MAG: polysaccharide pyruvyl transferase CsaB [Firmicutes bacterium]|nr:polysaccharide pyruvyl transferase CsaB [Bacillota bacterium]